MPLPTAIKYGNLRQHHPNGDNQRQFHQPSTNPLSLVYNSGRSAKWANFWSCLSFLLLNSALVICIPFSELGYIQNPRIRLSIKPTHHRGFPGRFLTSGPTAGLATYAIFYVCFLWQLMRRLIGRTLFTLSNSLVLISDLWKAFWADTIKLRAHTTDGWSDPDL